MAHHMQRTGPLFVKSGGGGWACSPVPPLNQLYCVVSNDFTTCTYTDSLHISNTMHWERHLPMRPLYMYMARELSSMEKKVTVT